MSLLILYFFSKQDVILKTYTRRGGRRTHTELQSENKNCVDEMWTENKSWE
jgi:hypothetical protein